MLCSETAELARAGGLVVDAGHDLNLRNLPPFLTPIPFLAEASIGHEITVDALLRGLVPAVRSYAAALDGAGQWCCRDRRLIKSCAGKFGSRSPRIMLSPVMHSR
jgi:hypothetical protein